MITKLKDGEYIVRFSHCRGNNQCTECTILKDDEVFVGIALKSPKDQFNKEVGRQVALRKTLKQMDLTKEQRRIFWNTYRFWGKKRF